MTPAQEKQNFQLAATAVACVKERYALLPPILKKGRESIAEDPFQTEQLCLYQAPRKDFLLFVKQGFSLYPRLTHRTYFFAGFSLDIVYRDGSNSIQFLPSDVSFPEPVPFVSICLLKKTPLFVRYRFQQKKKWHTNLKKCADRLDSSLSPASIHYSISTK